MFYEEFILKRHPDNPIIKSADFPGAEAIMNPGQTMCNGKTILLVAVFHRSCYHRGKPGPTTHVAESADGIHFKINPEPFLQISNEEPYKSLDWHPIDTRITKIEDTYYIIHPGCSDWGAWDYLAKQKTLTYLRAGTDLAARKPLNSRVNGYDSEKEQACFIEVVWRLKSGIY